MLFALLFIFLGYKRAKNAGKNGILWGTLAGVTFIGTQLLTGLMIGIFLGIGVEVWGWSEDVFEKYELGITLIAVVLSFITAFIVVKLADRNPVIEDIASRPPPPPKFEAE